ncbi:MAG TPA: NfeD family protein [Candidatus Dormibacteraeota bacterium]|jgi:membrane protein implicated in regulation of membrane protease activity
MVVAWVVFALAMAVVEVASVAFYAVFLALGALAASVAALAGANVYLQAGVFLVVALIGILGLRPVITRRRGPRLVSGAQGMIGQTGIVVEPIQGEHVPGHVRLAGESWPAVSADGRPIAADATVTVLEIRGSTLVVHS